MQGPIGSRCPNCVKLALLPETCAILSVKAVTKCQDNEESACNLLCVSAGISASSSYPVLAGSSNSLISSVHAVAVAVWIAVVQATQACVGQP